MHLIFRTRHIQRALWVVLLLLGLTEPLDAGNVTLAWDPNTEPDLAGYEVFYGTQPGTYTASINAGNQTTWQITGLTAGQTYYFAVRAYNTGGERSAFSSEVTTEIPGDECTFSLSPMEAAFAAAGGAGKLTIATSSECAWTATSTVPWITVTSGVSGTGSGTVSFEVSPNIDQERTGSLTVAGQTFMITQACEILGRESVILGFASHPADGGKLQARGSAADAFAVTSSWRVPLDAYNSANGVTFPAVGDVDGDGLDEVVVGLGAGGAGWIFVFDDGARGYRLMTSFQIPLPAYNSANGAVHPAVGDLNGDGRAEIVAGLGEGSAGRYAVFENVQNEYRLVKWLQVPWRTYRMNSGETRPAVGDVDGDGVSEIVVGLGRSGQGRVEVTAGAPNFAHRAWLRVPLPSYNSNPEMGHTFPAVGDIDGDGKAEIVVGLGPGGAGNLAVFDDASADHSFTGWIELETASVMAVGEMHPALGNVDGDPAAELVIGLADSPGEGGRFLVRDDAANGHVILGSGGTQRPDSEPADGATSPAVGKLR